MFMPQKSRYWGYIGIMEKKMEKLLYDNRVYIGVIRKPDGDPLASHKTAWQSCPDQQQPTNFQSCGAIISVAQQGLGFRV